MHKDFMPIMYKRGQAMVIVVVLFLVGSTVVLGGVATSVQKGLEVINTAETSRQSFFASESGVEDVAYRIKNLKTFSNIETLLVGGALATTSVQADLDEYEVVAIGDEDEFIRRTRALIVQGTGASFNFGLQSDEGGIHLKNNSLIQGNAYSNGPITGENSNMVNGDVISAGPDGLIDGVHVANNGYAHTIADSTIDNSAYYQVISDTTVGGVEYPGSPDLSTSTLPISDELIMEWESDAEAGGTFSSPCPFELAGDSSLGSAKINCDLKISGNLTLTLTGPVWVAGDIIIEGNAVIRVSSSLSGKSVPIIADDPLNRTNGSTINLKNSPVFEGSGDGSFILLISQNDSAENQGSITAIEVQNNVGGDLLVYAGHGKVVVKNSVSVKEVTGYRVEAENFAEIVYESGLASLLFTSGPSGGFIISDWSEIE